MAAGQLFAVALAILIGVTLGALGSGGSITALPVLVYVAGMEPKTAVAVSLAVVGGASVAGALLHWHRGNFHAKAAAVFGGSGIPGAYVGAAFTHMAPSSVLMLLFSGLMLIVGILMFRGGAKDLTPGRCRVPRCAAVGAAVGFFTGFLGVGGGFLIVPALVLFAGLDTRKAVGTSLAIIALNSASGLARQVRFVTVDWTFAILFLAAALLGMAVGFVMVRHTETRTLTRMLAGALIVVGLAMGGAQVWNLV